MTDVRRMDDLHKTLAEIRRKSDDDISTLLARMATHSHDPIDLVGSTPAYARFASSTNQTVNNASDTVVSFGSAEYGSGLVTQTAYGDGHYYSFSTSGIWNVTASVRFLAGGTGERYGEFRANNYGAEDTIIATGGMGGSYAHTMTISTTDYFASGNYLFTRVFQSSGAALALLAGPAHRRIRFTLLRKIS